MTSDDIPISKAPTMHGVPTYLDTALWRQSMELQQARDEGEALWLHGFMCGLSVALVVAAVAFWRRSRRSGKAQSAA